MLEEGLGVGGEFVALRGGYFGGVVVRIPGVDVWG